jgi:hypothetical protein
VFHLHAARQAPKRGGISAELGVFRVFSSSVSPNEMFAPFPASAITACTCSEKSRTARMSAMVTMGLRRRARSSASSSVIKPTRSTRNVSAPTSPTIASAT